MRVWPGQPHPLGATWDGEGVGFSVVASRATMVELCLFDVASGRETERIALPERTRGAWHGYVPGLAPGQPYGFRVHGPRDPARGLWHDPAKLLVDPLARALSGALRWDAVLAKSAMGRDSAPFVPRALVVDPNFHWGHDAPPRTPWSRTIVYEAHVKQLSARHPGVPPHLRGTYLGLASDVVIEHLHSLGVTALELLPVMHHVPERHLLERGRTNAWGYSPLSFFAPHAAYATADDGRQVREFQQMVKILHRAGIEVILDVCYGHACEGGADGLMLSLAGFDAPTYYRIDEHGQFEDFTGCGNTLNLHHPRTLQLVMDSLRFWVREMHVDGFRFDQAVVLGRTSPRFDAGSRFFAVLEQDPVLQGVKLIAEPWDLGPEGYRLGGFPAGFAEWNDRFRDDVRRAWRGDRATLPALASRLAGSSDVFGAGGRGPAASLNFITCHDGFTLRDVTSYATKHNESNGEEDRDGRDENLSHSWGHEGETPDGRIRRRRARIQRALLGTLAFSQGVPMLLMGDEMGRTQGGNNNAYCHDDERTWVDWDLDDERSALLDFTRKVLLLRQSHPVLRRRSFFHGAHLEGTKDKDITWIHPQGREMADADWSDDASTCLGMLISGEASDYVDEQGHPVRGRTLLLLVNSGRRRVRFSIPSANGARWLELIHTARTRTRSCGEGRTVVLPRSLVLLEREERR